MHYNSNDHAVLSAIMFDQYIIERWPTIASNRQAVEVSQLLPTIHTAYYLLRPHSRHLVFSRFSRGHFDLTLITKII
jgi:hypothetical protein